MSSCELQRGEPPGCSVRCLLTWKCAEGGFSQNFSVSFPHHHLGNLYFRMLRCMLLGGNSFLLGPGF